MAEPIRNPHDFGESGVCKRCDAVEGRAATEPECPVPARKLSVVTPIRSASPAPTANGLATQLEELAALIREEKVLAQRVLVVVEDQDGDIDVYPYGALRTMLHDIGMLDEGKEYIRQCVDLGEPVEPPKKEG